MTHSTNRIDILKQSNMYIYNIASLCPRSKSCQVIQSRRCEEHPSISARCSPLPWSTLPTIDFFCLTLLHVKPPPMYLFQQHHFYYSASTTQTQPTASVSQAPATSTANNLSSAISANPTNNFWPGQPDSNKLNSGEHIRGHDWVYQSKDICKRLHDVIHRRLLIEQYMVNYI